jgi:hypothetical protein
MNKTLCIAPALLLCACASIEAVGNKAPAPVAGEATYFCWRDRLLTVGDTLVCNWERSSGDACRSNNRGSVEKTSVAAGPKNAGRCENGQWLVQVTTK